MLSKEFGFGFLCGGSERFALAGDAVQVASAARGVARREERGKRRDEVRVGSESEMGERQDGVGRVWVLFRPLTLYSVDTAGLVGVGNAVFVRAKARDAMQSE